jgi:predicted dehydrogenase
VDRGVRIGFVGCGAHATRSIYPSLRHAPIELIAVCDLVEERAEATARAFGGKRWYTDFRAMLESEDLDALFVVVGPDAHPPIAIDAMRAGLHVFVEKPPCRTIAQAEEMAEVSCSTGKFLMVAFKKRFCPTYVRAREILDSEEFGSPTSIDARLGLWIDSDRLDQSASTPDAALEDRFFMLLLDYFIHHLDLLRFFMGEVEELYYERNVIHERPTYAASLRFKNGAIGSLYMTALQSPNSFQERVEIVGEGSNVAIDNVSRLTYYRRAASPPEDSFVGADQEAPLVWEPAFSLSQVRNKVLFIGGFAGEVRHFADSVLSGTAPTCDISDGLEAVRLVHALCQGPGRSIRMEDIR